jgi:ornithine cyclodeaminase
VLLAAGLDGIEQELDPGDPNTLNLYESTQEQRAELGIETLRVFDVDPLAMEKLARHAKALGFDVVLADDAGDAARGADVITTCTADKQNATVLHDADVPAGVFINAIGGDCPGKTELHGDILRRPDARVVVEFEPQSRIEGEVQQLDPSFAVTEFSDVVLGNARVRTADEQVTIFDSVGFALEDFSAMRYLYELHETQRGVKRRLDLVPDLDDPKDLFGELAGRLTRGSGFSLTERRARGPHEIESAGITEPAVSSDFVGCSEARPTGTHA